MLGKKPLAFVLRDNSSTLVGSNYRSLKQICTGPLSLSEQWITFYNERPITLLTNIGLGDFVEKSGNKVFQSHVGSQFLTFQILILILNY
jgi:hypothetical protein